MERPYTIATYDQPAYPFMWNLENQYRGTDANGSEFTKEQAQAGIDYILGPTRPGVTTTMQWNGEAPTAADPTGQPRVTFHLSNLNPGKEYTLAAHIPQLRNTDLDQLYTDNPGDSMIMDPAGGGYSSGAFPAAPKLEFKFITTSDTATITATLPSSTITPGTPYYLHTTLYEESFGSGIYSQDDIDRYKEFRKPLTPEEVTEAFTNAYDANTEAGEDQKAANLSYDAANMKITSFSEESYETLQIYDQALFTTAAPHRLLTQEEFRNGDLAYDAVRFNNLNIICGSGSALANSSTGTCTPTTWSTLPITVNPEKPSETTSEPDKPSESTTSEPSEPAASEPAPSEPSPSKPSESVKPSKPTKETSEPASSEPKSSEPSEEPSSEPESSEPESSKPSEPATSEPESSKPSEPEFSKPETSEPESSEPSEAPSEPSESIKPSKPTGSEKPSESTSEPESSEPSEKPSEPSSDKPSSDTPRKEGTDSEKTTSTTKDKDNTKDKVAVKPKAKASSDNDNKPNKAQERANKPVGPRVVTGGTLAA